MKCTDLEILLCEYVDGTLSASEKATVELHLAECAACRQLADDGKVAVEFIERVAEVEVPAALVNKILFEARAGKASPVKKSGAKSWVGKLFEPILQPKFAMGMAMTILSFSMLGRFAGVPARQLKASDLEPAKVWATLEDKAYRSWERAKKYYESLRLVYEMQQTLNDWSEGGQPGQNGQNAQSGQSGSGSQGSGQQQTEGPIEKRPDGEKKVEGEGRANP